MQKVYYAHHLWKYNTEIESYELDLIHKYFTNEVFIINPNGHIIQTKSESDIMIDCFKTIAECDILVYSSVSGVVGKGVYEEILLAESLGKIIYYIYNSKLEEKQINKFELLNSGSNRLYAIVV